MGLVLMEKWPYDTQANPHLPDARATKSEGLKINSQYAGNVSTQPSTRIVLANQRWRTEKWAELKSGPQNET
ncbi:hypothetical protein Pcinc_027922 [Petrolisthes cinctipes]|uniref:Uncharacterized protein n=1 Tax=Petrolisthes cinctipes TaxID=88211 RepID=A0AAE1F438_PETCI|nr:hypothetical protein Pcinc_027922 [Petrolisthes cinctipes]